MPANINLPRILRVGAGASQQLVPTLAELGLSQPLLVTDPSCSSAVMSSVCRRHCARPIWPLACSATAFPIPPPTVLTGPGAVA